MSYCKFWIYCVNKKITIWSKFCIYTHPVNSKLSYDTFYIKGKTWWYFATFVQLPYGLRIAELFNIQLTGPPWVSTWVVGLPCIPKNRANFAAEVDMPRRYGCQTAKKYDFVYWGLAAALRNRAICSYEKRTAAAIVMWKGLNSLQKLRWILSKIAKLENTQTSHPYITENRLNTLVKQIKMTLYWKITQLFSF